MGKHVTIENVRISYPSLFKPRVSRMYPASQPKYEASFLVDNKSSQTIIPDILAAINEITLTEFGGVAQKAPTWETDQTTGVTTIRTRSGSAVVVADEFGNALNELNNKIYAGCRVKAIISVYKHNFGNGGISLAVEGVQFMGDDERLDNRTSIAFEPINPNVVQPPVNAQGMPAVTMPPGVAAAPVAQTAAPVAAAPVAAAPVAAAPVAAAPVAAAPVAAAPAVQPVVAQPPGTFQ